MKKCLVLIILTTILLTSYVFSATEFKVGVGDRLTITVYEHEDMSLSARVSGDGTINVPFLGNVLVAGLTANEIAKKLSSEYVKQEYLVNPQITVFIDEYKSRKASILGEVSNPGRYELEDNTTVMVLVTMASGFTPKALKKYANIIRKVDGKDVVLEKVPLDERVLPGDVIVIPESFF
jgi:polysaccharide export outer membrane protein